MGTFGKNWPLIRERFFPEMSVKVLYSKHYTLDQRNREQLLLMDQIQTKQINPLSLPQPQL